MKYYHSFILILFITCCNAQIKGVVKNRDGKSVPFVSIWVEGKPIRTTSAEDGSFILNTKPEGVVCFSTVGYYERKINASEVGIVTLDEKHFILNEVVINSKSTKTLLIGNFKETEANNLLGNLTGTEICSLIAKVFPYQRSYSETPLIQKAIVYTYSKVDGAVFRLRLFSLNTDGIPEVDLLYKELIVSVKEGFNRNEIDLEDYNISFPEKGMAVGFEWLLISQNEYQSLNNKKAYAPVIATKQQDNGNTYMFAGKWLKIRQSKYSPANNMVEPGINLVLTN